MGIEQCSDAMAFSHTDAAIHRNAPTGAWLRHPMRHEIGSTSHCTWKNEGIICMLRSRLSTKISPLLAMMFGALSVATPRISASAEGKPPVARIEQIEAMIRKNGARQTVHALYNQDVAWDHLREQVARGQPAGSRQEPHCTVPLTAAPNKCSLIRWRRLSFQRRHSS